MIEFAKSPYVNHVFDDYRREIYGDRLITSERLGELIAGFTDGMKPAAIESLRSDPYYGIRSRGRTGARKRLALQMQARQSLARPAKPDGRIFRNERRHAKFTESYKALVAVGYKHDSARKQAAKNARRISVKGV